MLREAPFPFLIFVNLSNCSPSWLLSVSILVAHFVSECVYVFGCPRTPEVGIEYFLSLSTLSF